MAIEAGELSLLEAHDTEAGVPTAPSQGPTPSVSSARRALRRFLHNPGAVVAAGFLLVVILAAIFAPLVATHDPNAQELTNSFDTPSGDHWLGTDDLGRDIFSRLVYGARISMTVSISVVAIGLIVAIPIGLVSGYYSGRLDNILMRLTDAGLSFPPLVLALAVAGVLGPGVRNVILALAIVFIPAFIRVVRGSALAVREETFIEASRTIGTRTGRILRSRMFPNVRSPLIVLASFSLSAALLAEAGLAYLGLGQPPPDASWGTMLRRAYDTSLFTDPWQLMIPGAAIALTVLAFNIVGDGLRDALGIVHRRRRGGRIDRRGLTTVQRSGQLATTAVSKTDALLAVKDLAVEFATDRGASRVVDHVDLDIGRGEVVGLAGESGSGKTVTSLAIMRLIPSPPGRIVGGQILFEGRDLLSLPFKEMRKVRGAEISMIFQDPMASLDPAFTVGNLLSEAQRLHGKVTRKAARNRARELLDLVKIPAPDRRLSDYPHNLSGGMRQRVMIALALSCDPKLLIADEPTTALDVTVQAQILELLRGLQADLGLSILLVTHDLGAIADICDRVSVMYAGQIVEQSAIDDLFSRPRHPYTEGLLAAMPQAGGFEGELTVIPGQVPHPHAMPPGCRFEPRCSYAEEACRAHPIELAVDERGTLVRCRRADELVLRGSE